ncbi:MAG: twin-arginine translocation signal domain-containing protein [Gemmataceae bacterium]
MPAPITRRAFLAAAAAATAGCGQGIAVPKTVPVRGRVTVKGKPAAGVTVTFHPRFDVGPVKFTPSGTTGRDGGFTLSTASPGDGAPRGEYVVTFAQMQVQTDRKAGNLEVEVDAWKGKYGDPAASKWTATVGPCETQLEPFNLE